MVLAYCLPFERIFYNFSTGAEGIGRNPGWYQMIFDYDASTLDLATESLMLKAAATPVPPSGENVLQQALRVYVLDNKDIQFQYKQKYYEYEWMGKTYTSGSYERYWHGYLIFLKPLLCLFTAHDIIFLNTAAQIGTMYIITMALRKRGKAELQIPFLVLWTTGMQSVIMFSIDYAACFYIYSFLVLALLLGKKTEKNYIYAFMIAGMCTSYLDFLTWPLITLGIPLVVLLYEERETDVRQQYRKILVASLAWGTGYGGMWAGKWALASLFLGENIMDSAMEAIGMRSGISGNVVQFSYLETLFRNVNVFIKKPYLILFATIFFYLVILFIRSRRMGKRPVYVRIIPFLIVMVYPFVWYFFTRQHSGEHYWMTWRILTISVFAFLCGALACQNAGEQK